MKFNYFTKTKIALAIVMILIMVAYLVSMTGTLIKYEDTQIVMEKNPKTGLLETKFDENDEPVIKHKTYEISELAFAWFPKTGGQSDVPTLKSHSEKLYEEISAYADEGFMEEYPEKSDMPNAVTLLAFLSIIGVVVIILAAMSLFTDKKVLWTVFASIWGIVGVYYYLTNDLVKAAGKIDILAEAGGMMQTQTILAIVGCVVGIASLVISVYAKRKSRKMIMANALKRD